MDIVNLLNDPRLEDAFKSPNCDEQGYAAVLPAIWKNYQYGQTADGVKIISKKSAIMATALYSKFLDEETIVWDSDKNELFLYSPDIENPCLAFKGSSWIYARKLKDEYCHLNLYDVYMEIKNAVEREIEER